VGEHLGLRALNRAMLDRQLLLNRHAISVEAALTRLVGMQAQAPNPPYYGLWSRLRRFTPSDLSELVVGKQVVRMALMRSTIHLVTADDALMLKPLLQPMLDRGMQGPYGKRIEGVDREALLKKGVELVEAEPLTFKVLGEALARHFGKGDPHALAMGMRMWAALVQVPPRGLWGAGGQAAHTTAQKWLGRPLRTDAGVDEVFLRYLAGFGPATVKDVQTWSGLVRLNEVADRLKHKLRAYDGGYLDLPDAPRPDEDTPAPVRYLAEFENMLLSYADRTRIIAEEHRKRLFSRANGMIPGTFTVGGFVAGEWTLASPKKGPATLTLSPYAALSKKDTSALQEEAAKLLEFAAPGAAQEIVLQKQIG
jgi:DNA glycosylase AlkZ-like